MQFYEDPVNEVWAFFDILKLDETDQTIKLYMGTALAALVSQQKGSWKVSVILRLCVWITNGGRMKWLWFTMPPNVIVGRWHAGALLEACEGSPAAGYILKFFDLMRKQKLCCAITAKKLMVLVTI